MDEHRQDHQALIRQVQQEAWDDISELLDRMHVQDIADALGDFPSTAVIRALESSPRERWAAILAYLEPPAQHALLLEMDPDDTQLVLAGLLPDDLTALLESLDQPAMEQLLQLLPQLQVQRALKQLGYPEQSAGRLMNTRFVTIRAHWSAAEALDHVRRRGETEDTINTLYVTDDRRRLLGTVGLKRLVLNPQDTLVEQLIGGQLIAVQAGADREEAARLIQRYDITALPVVDSEGRLLGVVTVDDVLDVVEEENTEDFHKLGAVGAMTYSLREARPSLLYRKRVGWLVLLVFMNLFGGAGIAYFEDTITATIALVFFLPLIVDSGGNAGAQSATLMVRALATGDVQLRHWFALWSKELGVATALGVTMAVAVWSIGLWRGGMEVAWVVSLSMVLVVVVGSMIGMLLPFILTRVKLDPATASAPLITSIADISGILIYFTVATVMLTGGSTH
jgi:magnesium transporter